MAQHITTLNEIRERTVAEGFTPDIADIVSVNHGSGSKRHRAFTLGEIGDLLMGGGGLTEIELKKALVGGGYKVVTIDGESMEFSQYGGSSPDGTETSVSMLGMTISLTSQGYDTVTEITRDGVVVSYGPTGGTAEKTEVLYNKVRTKEVEGTSAGTGSESAKELVIASGLHVTNTNGSQYLIVEGPTELKGTTTITRDLNLTYHNEGGTSVPANLNVSNGLASLKSLQVGASGNKVLEATETNGAKFYKHADFQNKAEFNGGIAVGGSIVDCTSDTGDIVVDTKLAGITVDNAVAILYLRAGQVVNKGTAGSPTTITTQGACALPFYRHTSSSTWIPMFVANWT